MSEQIKEQIQELVGRGGEFRCNQIADRLKRERGTVAEVLTQMAKDDEIGYKRKKKDVGLTYYKKPVSILLKPWRKRTDEQCGITQHMQLGVMV